MAAKVPHVVVSFHTTTDALSFKQAAIGAGWKGRLAPIPRQLSAGCGMAWKEPGGNADQARLLAEGNGLEYEQIAELDL